MGKNRNPGRTNYFGDLAACPIPNVLNCNTCRHEHVGNCFQHKLMGKSDLKFGRGDPLYSPIQTPAQVEANIPHSR